MIKDYSSCDCWTSNDIMNHMCTKLGVHVSYYKAWRAKEYFMKSLNGDANVSYDFDPKFFYELEENESMFVFLLSLYH